MIISVYKQSAAEIPGFYLIFNHIYSILLF